MSHRNSDQSGGRRSSESSGAHSWLSQETVREGRSHQPQHNHEPSNARSVSPLSGFRDTDRPDPQTCASPTIKDPNDLYSSIFSWGSDFAPKDQRKPPQFGSHRKAMNLLGTEDPGTSPTANLNNRPPQLNLNPPDNSHQDAEPSLASSPTMAPNDGPSTFFNDYSEQEASPASNLFRPGTAQTYASEPLELDYNGDHRRPSVASAMTVSSQGSKSSAGALFKKKLQGFFGDEYVGNGEPRHDSDNFTQNSATKPSSLDQFRARERANSDGSRNPGASPAPNQARPHTPLPSSEITPWLYQSFNDIPQYGEAPVREAPTMTADGQRGSVSQRDQSRRHFSGHRHSRSKEEKPTVAGDLAGYSNRPATGRDDLSLGLRPSREGSLNYPTPMTSTTTLVGRSTSPTPSVQSAYSREQGQNSPGAQTSKRSFLDKIRRPKHGHLKNITGSKAVQETTKAAASKLSRREASPARRGRQGSIESGTSSRLADSGDNERKRDGKGLAIGSAKLRGRRGHGNEVPPGKDTRQPDRSNVWELDTDLSHMEGIVNPPSPSAKSKMFDGASIRSEETRRRDAVPAGNWDAPESWHVKKQNEPSTLLPQDTSEPGPTITEPDGPNWYIRIFRPDATFATLSGGLYATVADLVHGLSRKSFLTEHISNYELVMQKNDLSRQLDQTEMPILMQKRMLEQVGYTEKDRIEEVGREDHSYILRFTFLPARITGYIIDGNDPLGKAQQKFSHVDLSNRCLVTIPIGLYKKAPEIISLNLSKNLALDVPKDFIQGCINLREIKFIGNEALRLPASFGLASRLTYLDVSNNFLEDLTHANLDRLHGLVSIKMANNRLTKLPSYFGNFQYLRSLNISSNNFKVFPDLLCGLKSLVDLDISFNNISELPQIGKLATLERIWMTNNIVRGALDDTFRDLVNLKEIDARFNEITNIDTLCVLPRLEQVAIGHNAISKFKGSFPKLRTLALDHCPMTQFEIDAPMPTLTSLNIASAKLVQLRDTFFENLPNLTKVILDKNHFVSMSPHIGKLRKLEHFSMIKNPLAALPATIGCLTELKYLNLRECNLRRLPPEIWHCLRLETLNVSSNVLEGFPKHGSPQPQVPSEPIGTPAATPGVSTTPSYEELGALEEQEARRPSQTSGGVLSTGSSPNGGAYRKPSVASSLGQGRKVSAASRSLTDGSPSSRKDSNFSQHVATTFGGSLRNLYLADNRLEDDIFRELSLIPELRIVNLSYNELTELPQGLLRRWPLLTELYISGNELTSLPSDDLEEGSSLRVLHINANRFQVLPAELCKVSKLSILDVGSNSLKYNVSNWPYDWNWNWNRNLKYLNFSGNKRLEIKPPGSSLSNQQQQPKHQTNLTDFTSLTHLRVLGLMDVTLTITTIPEENEDRRVRTSASLAGSLAYGMADFLGKSEHLSIFDMIVPRLKPDKVETVVGMFDGQSQSSGGSRIAKFLHENFIHTFSSELKRMRPEQHETPLDALRRAFLTLNKNMAFACYKSLDQDVRQYQEDPTDQRRVRLTKDDIDLGGVATVMYLNNMDLYVANVGDAQAILVKADGSLRHLTQNHDPAETHERARIRDAGGFVSRTGKLNDVLTVSRAFGHFPMMPAVIAAPHTMHVNLTEQDEMVILASRELWDYVTPDLVVDVTRAERRDLMIAAQKIRDLAISFGATNKLMVMILGVGNLKRREKIRTRPSLSMVGPPEEQIIPSTKRTKKPRDAPGDSRLARFNYVDAPVGELAIIFTDIKKSTSLWETCPDAMRSAIQIHNDILRRQLGIIGGYEVKTEGDAFMVAFSTTTAALLWCFNCQTQLLDAEWPTEILEQPQCQVVYDTENNIIFRGLSVRMGSHWGEPVCEKDPVTNRMDYFGPMVNRASRISAVADGGQIFVSSDFMSDIQRNLEIFADSERAASTGSEESYALDTLGHNIRRELQQLNSQGFVIKDQGERKLKGLENPEPLYLIYPHGLSGRLTTLDKDASNELAPTTISKHSQLEIQTDLIWRLWEITLRLERLCAALEYPGEARLKEPNVALFNVVKNHGGELADSTVISLVEQQVTRIEVCITTLFIRNMMRPFRPGDQLNDHAVPITDVMQQLQAQLAEFRALKEQIDASAGTATSYTYTDPQYSNGESNYDSASSSYLHMGPPSDEFNPGGPRP